MIAWPRRHRSHALTAVEGQVGRDGEVVRGPDGRPASGRASGAEAVRRSRRRRGRPKANAHAATKATIASTPMPSTARFACTPCSSSSCRPMPIGYRPETANATPTPMMAPPTPAGAVRTTAARPELGCGAAEGAQGRRVAVVGPLVGAEDQRRGQRAGDRQSDPEQQQRGRLDLHRGVERNLPVVVDGDDLRWVFTRWEFACSVRRRGHARRGGRPATGR